MRANPPSGVCVSGIVHDQVVGKIAASFVDLGEQAVKNIAQPVRVWRVGPEVAATSTASASAGRPALPLPDKPSLVVLPFQNMSGDPEQEYFTDGMTEEITTALSRIRQFFVIARNTAFTYKGKKLDLKQVGRELGVRYLLEGSVRKAGNRVRITGQLIEAESGTHLWADKFDGALDDVFDLQDHVTSSVVGAIEPSINRAEIERASRKPSESLQAYDLLLRAIGESHSQIRERVDSALQLARQAVELDRRYALAWSSIAHWTAWRSILDWMDDPKTEIGAGLSAARRAVELDHDDPMVLLGAAYGVRVLADDTDTANQWLDRAIALNPNSATAFGLSARIRAHTGDYAIAADRAMRAIRLSPLDTETFAQLALGMSHFLRRDLPEGIKWLRQEVQQHPLTNSVQYLASALAHAGELDEARAVMARFLQIRPQATVSRIRQQRMYRVPADLDYILEGARIAGLPE